ncbi:MULTISPECIES: MCE family protein [Streptomycetaceae]|uniref:Virulence factor Mce family protein n=1 Tax=Streptantibioticus cattleyicolor (strain ATCC 35852 / DSM 46488 / JCM 4925 / NBRC 14057 / NRRL 8057) TaxID=1003195 RepID=F8JUH4_STREN|nr:MULTISPECIES: MlaD family protein [Streptomycetaceae]AEW95596.1 virulence factor Mce family protein [Streptantibioticus cattleyicolor NRRL 8057 = DSM 46488]MYS60146.1 MCE family protein [Streptomyces sp. SID5468]CCB75933.1 conserved protein of unknown function [Streptantibioticus cattleyicolor NRRL 8057 = DSM 46488]
MLTLAARLKNLAFLVIAVLVLGYLAVRYAGLGPYLGMRGYYAVRAELPSSGGLFEHAEVTYRGVRVGTVGPITLTADGVEAQLRIDDSAPPIPARLHAVVADLSAVGEQYIDLRPTTDGGPYLADGARVPAAETSVPAPVTNLLTSVDNLTASVPLTSLRTVVGELGDAFAGQAGNLQALLDNGSKFVASADQALPTDRTLMRDGATVLRTQADEGQAISGFATGARELAGQLAASDTDLRRVIAAAPEAAGQVSALLRDLDPDLSVVLANLLTTSEVAVTRQHGTEELLVRLPALAAAGSTAVTPAGARFGMAVTFFAPLPCTAGYAGTTYRNGLDVSPGPAWNTGARCTAPPGSGTDVRGSANAPSGGPVPSPARPGSLLPHAAGAQGLPGALSLPALPSGGPSGMAGLLGLGGGR